MQPDLAAKIVSEHALKRNERQTLSSVVQKKDSHAGISHKLRRETDADQDQEHRPLYRLGGSNEKIGYIALRPESFGPAIIGFLPSSIPGVSVGSFCSELRIYAILKSLSTYELRVSSFKI